MSQQKLFHKVRPTAPEDRVPLGKRIAYGFGNFTDHLGTDIISGNANPIFNIALHLDPRLLGLGMGICRFCDAITDPLFGFLSDNARTKWGRRRPYMLAGAIGCGLVMPILWMVPEGVSGWALFLWFTIFSMLFFSLQSAFTVPWTALGFELTPDYNERTRVMAWKAYLGSAVALLSPWAYKFTQLDIWGGNTLRGAHWMGIIVGVLLVLSGLIPVLFLTERFFAKARHQEKISFFKSVGMTLKNRPFLMMIVITLFTVVGSRTVDFLGFYIGLYYLFDGNTGQQGTFAGISGNVRMVISLISIFILDRVSRHIGKRKSLGICIGLLIVSSFAKWLFYNPEHPYLSLFVLLFTTPASAGFWLLIASIKADICDDDELATGLRREGAIGAISSWISRMSTSLTAILAGFVLAFTGYIAEHGASQAPGVVDAMRWTFYIIPSACAIPALILLWFFPITEARARETRRILEERRGKL